MIAINDDDLNYLLTNGMRTDVISALMENDLTVHEIRQRAEEAHKNGESLHFDGCTIMYNAKSAAAFGECDTRFIWAPYVPVGDYTVLMADGGTGKTILCCGIAAAISRGKPLPGDSFSNKQSNTVLIISAEDTGELLKKRLLASGANLERVFILDCLASEGLNFTDGYDDFLDLIRRYKPALTIIDPWHAFLGAGVDINRVNAVRPVFQRLANMAKTCDCGLVLVSHVNKRAQGENANNAATGSTDFINAARSAMRVIFDDEPGRENSRVLVHTKSNYAAPGKSVRYRITEDGGLVWDGFSDITRRTLEDAARWRKTTYEALQKQDIQDSVNRALIAAVKEHAEPGKTVNVSYDQMKADHGTDIFDSMQPKRALDAVANELWSMGYVVQTGKTVRHDGRTKNGFSVFKQEQLSDALEGLPE